jgi:hypothetical protein
MPDVTLSQRDQHLLRTLMASKPVPGMTSEGLMSAWLQLSWTTARIGSSFERPRGCQQLLPRRGLRLRALRS